MMAVAHTATHPPIQAYFFPATRPLAEGELHDHQRHRPEEQENGPGDQKTATAVGRHDTGKPPDVAGSDGHTERREHQAPAATELLVR